MAEITSQEKDFITQRAQGCCEYCWSQLKFSPDPFSIEHIIPLSKGGTYDLDNLALSCQGCNNRKYNYLEAYDPIDGKLVPLYHPRQQSRSAHFVWSDDFAEMIGISPSYNSSTPIKSRRGRYSRMLGFEVQPNLQTLQNSLSAWQHNA